MAKNKISNLSMGSKSKDLESKINLQNLLIFKDFFFVIFHSKHKKIIRDLHFS
jgi:hypothetical protein